MVQFIHCPPSADERLQKFAAKRPGVPAVLVYDSVAEAYKPEVATDWEKRRTHAGFDGSRYTVVATYTAQKEKDGSKTVEGEIEKAPRSNGSREQRASRPG